MNKKQGKDIQEWKEIEVQVEQKGINSKKEKQSSKKKKKRIGLKIFLIIFIILSIIASVFAFNIIRNGGGLQGLLATTLGHNAQTLKNLPEIRFLLLGQSGNLTDTIMACSYDPKTQQASILSVPRDTFIGKSKSSATAFQKINALCQKEYPEKTLKAVNEITGLNLEYYVLVDTKSLVQLVDKIGGIDFDVPINMDYDDETQDLYIHLKKGYQHLDGKQAEGLVRFRHNNDGSSYNSEYGDNDLGRMRTQREFITTIIKQTLNASNLFKIGDLLDICYKNVKTNLDLNYAKDYIPYAVNFNTENLRTNTVPGKPELCNGVSIYIHDKLETEKVVYDLFLKEFENVNQNEKQNKNAVIESSYQDEIKVEVLNASNNKKALSSVTNKLKENGYNVIKTGTMKATSKTSIINRKEKKENVEQDIKSILHTGTVVSESKDSKIDFTIIIGKDYK